MKKKQLIPEVLELQKLKEKNGWSFFRLATELGVHPQTIRAWLRTQGTPARPSNLATEKIRHFLRKNQKSL